MPPLELQSRRYDKANCKFPISHVHVKTTIGVTAKDTVVYRLMVKWLQRWREWLYITETIQLRTVAYGTLVRTFTLGSG